MAHLSYPAFHVLWTKPTIEHSSRFLMNEAEILTMLVSALMWQKYNGSIKLYTDKKGYELILQYELQNLWDDGMDCELLEKNTYPIESSIFWAAGKLIALEAQTCPCVMLDTDLIVLDSIHHLLKDSAITALHKEDLNSNTYPGPTTLIRPTNYIFPDFYNWNVFPSNTAFLYMKDLSFKEFYLQQSKEYMFHNAIKTNENVTQMVFAEQRLLSICAHHLNIPINYLLENPFSITNNSIIHLWGFKKHLNNATIQKIYCQKLIERVWSDLSANLIFRDFVEKYFEYNP